MKTMLVTAHLKSVVRTILPALLMLTLLTAVAWSADNPAAPGSPVKLIFIHHSCGQNWLADHSGGLGIALRDNNYFVSDTNYGWGPENIGDNTDIGHWWTWFQGPDSGDYLAPLYSESETHCSYSRMATDPGGDNQIVIPDVLHS